MRILCCVLLLLVASSAVAQPRGRAGAGSGAANPDVRREELKKKIRALRAYTLTEELGLDDKTAAKLFPVLARWDDVTDKLLAQRTQLVTQLAAVDTIKDPKRIDRLIDDSIANQRAFYDLEDKRLAELRTFLTPAQTAKLVLVLPAFERRIQNQLRRAVEDRRGGRARGRAGRAASDDVYDPFEEQPGRPEPRGGGPTRAPRAHTPCDPFSNRGPC